MANLKTDIEWTDATWSPVRGCSRVSEGCRNCYAEKQAARIQRMDRGCLIPVGDGSYDGLLAVGGQWNGNIKLVVEKLYEPLQWKKPRKIFVNSMSDLFHDGVPDSYIDHVFAVMAAAEQHTFQILTKRPERMLKYMTELKSRIDDIGKALMYRKDGRSYRDPDSVYDHVIDRAEAGFPNVWLGVSVEDQKTADERIKLLLQTPASIRWISAEPLLGPINLKNWLQCTSGHTLSDRKKYGCNPILDWVVVGGESGEKARPMHPSWVRGLRNQCAMSNVPFLFKQWGEWLPRSACYHTFEDGSDCGSKDPSASKWLCVRLTESGKNGRLLKNVDSGCDAYMQRVGKKMAGRLLDGVLHDAYPVGGAA